MKTLSKIKSDSQSHKVLSLPFGVWWGTWTLSRLIFECVLE